MITAFHLRQASFRAPPRKHTSILRSSRSPNDTNGNKEETSVNGPNNDERMTTRTHKRAADYPSRFYDEADPRRTTPAVVIPGGDNRGDSNFIVDSLALTVTGGYESGLGEIGVSALRNRLLENRSYAKKEPFSLENTTLPPSLSDLSYPPSSFEKGFWISLPARVLTCVGAYLVLPYLTSFLGDLVTMPAEQLEGITSKFGPGISILYGTFISLTLSILYNRVKDIQDAVARESSLLVLVTRYLLTICGKTKEDGKERAVEAAQCCADQVRTLVRSSRGRELMVVMYSDPYAKLMEILDDREEALMREQGSFGSLGNLLGDCRDSIKNLIRMRAERLSVEVLSLPPTHFQVLNLLTLLILLSFVVSILPTIELEGGQPPNESRIIFAILTNVYVLFDDFARDLNNPFDGVYQIQRCGSAVHLLEAKWLISNHPLTRGKVDFEELEIVEEGDKSVVTINSPGLGEMVIETEGNDLCSTQEDEESNEEI